VAGGRWANEGLKQALCGQDGGFLPKGYKNYLEWYRRWIYGRGIERGMKEDGSALKPGFRAEEVTQVQEVEQGRLPSVEAFNKRVRYFTDGLVVGTKDLLNSVFDAQRDYFSEKRRSGPRKMRGEEDWGALRSMRDLRRG
jgi:putative transposase